MRIRTILLSVALVAAAGAGAMAEPGTAKLTPKAARAVELARTAKPVAKAAPARSGIKAAKDTGSTTLRAPTDDEDAALGSTPATPSQLIVGPNGSLTAVLGDDFMSDLTVVKGPDGKLTTSCGPRGHRHVHPSPKQPVRPVLETK